MSQPYSAPVTVICSSNTTPNTIDINLTPYTAFVPTNYILKTYTNNVLTSTSSPTVYLTNQIIVNGLSDQNVYAFQVQLINNTLTSAFSLKNENIPVYPVGPTMTGVTNITSTTAQVNYTTYNISGATCIVNGPGISNLTNTSVTLTGLTPNTAYTTLTILFRKTINGFVIDSSLSAVPSFTTNGIAPVVLSSNATTATNATLLFNNYFSATPGQFNFTSAIVTAPGATPSIVSITQPNTINIGNLSPATNYNGCTLTLTDSGVRSDPSDAFTIKTLALGPTFLAQSSSTTTTIALTFTKPASPFGTIQSIRVFYSTGEFGNVTLVNQGEVRINGLNSGQTYSDVYIIVSDGTFTSMPSNIVASITSTPSPAPTGISSTAGANSVTIQYTSYTAFTPSSGTLYNSSGTVLGTVSASPTQMVVGGLSPITYTGSYIILTDGSNTSGQGIVPSFTPLAIPIYTSNFVDFGFGFSKIYVEYQTFTAFVPTGAASRLYTDQGVFVGEDPVTQPEAFVIFGNIPSTIPASILHSNCYIILSNGTTFSAPSEPRFQFIT